MRVCVYVLQEMLNEWYHLVKNEINPRGLIEKERSELPLSVTVQTVSFGVSGSVPSVRGNYRQTKSANLFEAIFLNPFFLILEGEKRLWAYLESLQPSLEALCSRKWKCHSSSINTPNGE